MSERRKIFCHVHWNVKWGQGVWFYSITLKLYHECSLLLFYVLYTIQVKGRLEGGQLYTPVYVARVSSMVRGAARGITVPTNLSALWSSLQQLLQEMNGSGGVAVEGSFFQSLFNGLVKEGEILGSLRAGVHWTPTV